MVPNDVLGKLARATTVVPHKIPVCEVLKLPFAERISEVAYGNGKYVAIASAGKAFRSTDEISWTQGTIPYDGFWVGIAFGNGKFVAVTGDNPSNIAYSSDAVNWSLATVPSGLTICSSIAFGNGIFVTASANSDTLTSVDGINFIRTVPTDLHRVIFSNGVFIGLVYGTHICKRSADGVVWKQSTIPINSHYISSANSLFFVTENRTDRFAYSPDAINWTSGTFCTPAGPEVMVAYGYGIYIAMGWSGKLYFSEDLERWGEQSISAVEVTPIKFLNDRFLSLPRVGTDGIFLTKSGIETVGILTDILGVPISILAEQAGGLPYVTGSYTGNAGYADSTPHHINIGFKPSAVIIKDAGKSSQRFPVFIATGSNKMHNSIVLARITADGFDVSNANSDNDCNMQDGQNSPYAYIAFR